MRFEEKSYLRSFAPMRELGMATIRLATSQGTFACSEQLLTFHRC